MSGECEMCGEHIVDCECGHTLATHLRDRCNRVSNLLDCLLLILNDKDKTYQTYKRNPHLDLILTIEVMVEEIEKGLQSL